MMHQNDIDTELADAASLLDSTTMAHLAYTSRDGTPRVIPIGFYWTGTQFVVSTAATAPKVATLAANPDVALAIDAGDSPSGATSLSVRGRADIQIVDGVVEEYLAASRKSMDPESAAQFEAACRDLYDQMARIAITPTWARFYDFGIGRIPKFLQDLAQRSAQ